MNINSKVTELRSEVSQRTKVPAHAGTSLSKTLPSKIQLDGKAYTAIQGDNGLEPPAMGQHELILEISLKNVWQEYSLKKT